MGKLHQLREGVGELSRFLVGQLKEGLRICGELGGLRASNFRGHKSGQGTLGHVLFNIQGLFLQLAGQDQRLQVVLEYRVDALVDVGHARDAQPADDRHEDDDDGEARQ